MMGSYIIYGFYNLIFQGLSIWFLLYANTYLNGFLIPKSFRWKDGKLREDLTALAISQTTILIIEATLLLLLLYYVNKWFLSNIIKAENVNSIAIWTGGIYAIITLSFIAFIIYASFK